MLHANLGMAVEAAAGREPAKWPRGRADEAMAPPRLTTGDDEAAGAAAWAAAGLGFDDPADLFASAVRPGVSALPKVTDELMAPPRFTIWLIFDRMIPDPPLLFSRHE